MAHLLKEDLHFIGALNPNLRVFDIIMKTEYGTTYNSYLVTGEKTAVIETVHDQFGDAFLRNISEIVPPEQVDYIVMNHTEPDHAGSIARLLEKNPDLTVVGTVAAIRNVSNILNRSFNQMVVKAGDTLDLGRGLVLHFIPSPNLHWPDSMFTWLPARKTVFTCDFLGAHYCEPLLLDRHITDSKAYDSAFLNYYTAIFGPFKKFVLDGLAHLEKLDFDMVCTSHGPILTEGYREAMEKYRAWSTPSPREKNVAIFYVSAYGYTRKIAEVMARVLETQGVPAKTYDVICYEPAQLVKALEDATGVMFGSPTINRDAVKPVWDLLSSVDAINNKGKPCLIFGSYGWSGEGCKLLRERAAGLGFRMTGEEFRFLLNPSDDDIAAAEQLAKNFAAAL